VPGSSVAASLSASRWPKRPPPGAFLSRLEA
jgi:hypothetical protein